MVERSNVLHVGVDFFFKLLVLVDEILNVINLAYHVAFHESFQILQLVVGVGVVLQELVNEIDLPLHFLLLEFVQLLELFDLLDKQLTVLGLHILEHLDSVHFISDQQQHFIAEAFFELLNLFLKILVLSYAELHSQFNFFTINH